MNKFHKKKERSDLSDHKLKKLSSHYNELSMSENPIEEQSQLPFFQLAAENDQIPKL